MSRDTDDRDVALRRLLVAQAQREPRGMPWPAIVGTVAVVALLGGVAIGATAFRGSGEAQPASPELSPAIPDFDRPAFITPDSQIVGEPFVVEFAEAVEFEAGLPPEQATGLAIWTRCLESGRFEIALDGEERGGASCTDDRGNSGGYWRYAATGSNVITLTPDGGRFETRIAWVVRGADTVRSAPAEDAISDGVVTEEEYRAGFARYVACMSDWGVTVDPGYEVDGVIHATYTGSGTGGAQHECYGTEFSEIDMLWQSSRAG